MGIITEKSNVTSQSFFMHVCFLFPNQITNTLRCSSISLAFTPNRFYSVSCTQDTQEKYLLRMFAQPWIKRDDKPGTLLSHKDLAPLAGPYPPPPTPGNISDACGAKLRNMGSSARVSDTQQSQPGKLVSLEECELCFKELERCCHMDNARQAV